MYHDHLPVDQRKRDEEPPRVSGLVDGLFWLVVAVFSLGYVLYEAWQ